VTGKALVALTETGDQNIITASSSATTTVFNLSRTGAITVAAGQGLDTLAAGALNIGTTTQTALTLGRSGATTTITGSTVNIANLTTNGVVYTSGGNGTLNTEALLAISRGGTNSNATPTAGAIAYGTGTAYAFNTAGTSGQPLLSGGTGAPTFGTLGLVYGGTNADLSGVATGGLIYKAASSLAGTGALSGILQGNGSSAPSAITGTANYLPKWSASAPYLTATSSIFDNGNVGIGTTSPLEKLDISGNATASGNLTFSGAITIASRAFNQLTIGDTQTGDILLSPGTGKQVRFFSSSNYIDSSGNLVMGGNLTVGGTTTFNNITYTWPSTQTANYVLSTNGSGTLSWVDPAGAASSAIYWNQQNGLLFPKNSTVDLTIGGQSTSSAKFAFINVNSGTPTASISGNLALAVPTGATPANQLKLLNGGSFTIRISPGGDVGLEDAFQITKGGAILGTGNTTFGITPTSGAGNRMMWIPAKAAFRAGRAGGTHWDDSNIGNYSVAFGESTRASGTHSFAAGIFTVASGNYSAALGYGNTASGTYAFVAGGNNSTAAGSNSLVLGNLSTANNTGSIVIGERADSNANNAIVIGTGFDTLNHLTSSIANSLTIGFNSTVGTFFVGPGSGAGTYGNVGIGTTSVEGLFKVQGAKTGKALAIFNETGDQAIFTASSSGLPRFTITNQGGIMLGNSVGASNQCLLGGSTASWGSCGSGSSQWTDGTGGIYYNSGNVAIGTTDPSLYKFFVNGVGNSKALSVFAGDGNQDLFTASTSGITRFLIDKTGNIGIGTTLPSVRLHVVNNSTLDGSWNQGILVENTGGSSGEAAVTFKSALSSNYWFTGINGADVYDIAYGTGFFNSNVKFRINSNGQIGIATTNPSATLDISGSASLSGDLTFRNTNVAHDINIFDGGSLTFRTSVGGNAVTKAAMTITNSANVGIGTTAPIGKLNVDGAVTGKALVILNETGNQAILTASKSGTTKFLIDNNGNVGIGTTNTSNAMLSVSGTSLFQDQITVSNKGIEFTESDTNPTCATGNFNIYADLSENKLKKCQNGTVSDLDTVGGGGGSSGIVVKYKSADETVNNSATLQNDDHLFFSIGANETWTFRFVLFANSGTTPDLKAAVSAPSGASCIYAAIDAEAAVTTPQVTTCGTATALLSGNGAYDVYEVVGTVVNGATAGTVTLQWAQNTATAANTIVAAGSYMHAFILVGSDLAELYYTNESDLVPGMVVSLDKNFSAGVVKAAKPYDTNTIGVVSTQPGLVIGEARERSMRTVPIALAGRIPVKVTNENGDIHAGDYLTSSSKPGYAMKATRSGPIIGQALEDAVMFDDHTGVVLMFVKNGFYFGSNVVLQDEKNMLGDLLLQNKSNNTNALNDGAISDIEALSSIITASKSDLLINLGEDGKVTFKGSSPAAITFDADGNAIFQGELTASKINGIIPGLTNLNDRMASLETTVATISALVASQSAIIEQYVIGTSASASLFNEIDSLLLDKKNAFEPSVFATEGVATISGNLRVKGTGLFESVVTILDALTTRKLISTGLATFLDDVLINGDTQFRGKVTFSQDTAGIVFVRKGSKDAVVIFKKPYQKPPIIHAAIMTDDAVNETLSAKILSENSEFIVTNVSKTGFKILLKKAAVVDIPFAWTAFVNAKE
jgi:hypothetical protein